MSASSRSVRTATVTIKRRSIALTGALVQEMEQLATEHRAKLIVFSEDRFSPASVERMRGTRFEVFYRTTPQWFRHSGAYFHLDPSQYHRTWADINAGFDSVLVPIVAVDHIVSDEDAHLNLAGNRQVLQWLADRLTTGDVARHP